MQRAAVPDAARAASTWPSCSDATAAHRRHRDAGGPARGARGRHPRRARRARRRAARAVSVARPPRPRARSTDFRRFAPAKRGRSRARDQHRREPSHRIRRAARRAASAHRPRATHRHHRPAGRGQEHDHDAARATRIASRDSPSASSAVDPTSPFTGGALLGDRIRMESVALDPGVYIRSLATRGSLGGLSVGDARGVPTCSTRSASIASSSRPSASARASWTSRARPTRRVVVLVPESGDSIQTLKAGLMEIADIFVGEQGGPSRCGPPAQRHRADARHARGRRSTRTCRRITASTSTRITNPARAGARGRARARRSRTTGRRRCCARSAAKGEGIAELVDGARPALPLS